MRNSLTLFSLLIIITLNVYSQSGWIQINPTPTSGNVGTLYKVAYLAENNFISTGAYGSVFRTTNGGVDWILQSIGINDLLWDITFVDQNNGWVVSRYGYILRTTDGGTNWNLQYDWNGSFLYSVNFINQSYGWAVGNQGTILKTTNGGINWSSKTVGTSRVLRDIFFTDTNNGWVVGYIYPTQHDSCIILRTTDGGETWIKQFSENMSMLMAVYFTDINNGIAVGSLGTILQTSNGGYTWTEKFSGGSSDFYVDICFTSAKLGWVVGWDGKLLKTESGGRSWVYCPISTSLGLNGISFLDSLNGVIVGENSIVFKTTNGGVTFLEENNLLNPTNFILCQNYPNPFNPSTKISWQSPIGGWQTLKVYDVLGNEVATLVNENKPAGSYEVEFNASGLTSGIYFYRLQSGSFMETKKLVLLK